MHQTLRVFAAVLSVSFAQPAYSATLRYEFEAGGSWGALQKVIRGRALSAQSVIQGNNKSSHLAKILASALRPAQMFQYVGNRGASLVLYDLNIDNVVEKSDASSSFDAVRIVYRARLGKSTATQNLSRLEAILPVYLPLRIRPSDRRPI